MKPYDVLRLGDDDNFTAVGGGSAITLNIYARTETTVQEGSSVTQGYTNVALNSDGTISGNISGAWYTTPTAGIGSSYWALVTITSGVLSNGTSGSRVSLATSAWWQVKTSGVATIRVSNVTGTIELWDAASGGNMVSTGSFVLEAYAESDGLPTDSELR